jgi:hypothetical protein
LKLIFFNILKGERGRFPLFMINSRGLDLIKPLPAGKGQVRFVVIVVDYFTK